MNNTMINNSNNAKPTVQFTQYTLHSPCLAVPGGTYCMHNNRGTVTVLYACALYPILAELRQQYNK